MVSALVSGVLVTLQLLALGSMVVLIVAPLAGIGRLSKSALIRIPTSAYVEVFRGTNALVQLYFVYYVLPVLGVSIDSLVAGTLVLGLNVGAYGSEVVRGAILALPREQIDAATVIGMSPWLRMRRIVFPQALLTMLPSLGNLLIDLLKLTAVTSLIGLQDLTFQVRSLRRFSGGEATLQLFGIAMLLYFAISYALGRFVRTAEVRMAKGRGLGRRNSEHIAR